MTYQQHNQPLEPTTVRLSKKYKMRRILLPITATVTLFLLLSSATTNAFTILPSSSYYRIQNNNNYFISSRLHYIKGNQQVQEEEEHVLAQPLRKKSTQGERKAKPQSRSHIEKINSFDGFIDFVHDKEDTRLTIVKFYSTHCKACQKFNKRYQRFANEIADQVIVRPRPRRDSFYNNVGSSSCSEDNMVVKKGVVRFGDVEYESNRLLCNSLNIKRLPYIQIYRSSKGKLTEFVCSPNQFQNLVDETIHYLKEERNDRMIKQEQDEMNENQNTMENDSHNEKPKNKITSSISLQKIRGENRQKNKL